MKENPPPTGKPPRKPPGKPARDPLRDPGELLRELFARAVASAQPAIGVPARLDPGFLTPGGGPGGQGRLVVIGAGKASAAMAQAVEAHWPGPLEGLVVTRYGYGAACERIEIIEAAHPVPDTAGLTAAARILEKVQNLGAQDRVLCLISGGGSALLPLPLPGISLEDKQQLSRELLRCGATISEINTVRRHLSAIKGGRLAAACHPARVLTLALSDVPGDLPYDVASGPTVADPTRCEDALALLRRYGVTAPPSIVSVLESRAGESIKPGDPRLAGHRFEWVATPRMALESAAGLARAAGYATHLLSDAIEGEAREVAKVLGALTLETARHGQPFAAPCLLLSGGETTVTVRGSGEGGRNVEFLLALALALQGEAGVYALAADTDGVDGQQEVAGAVITPSTLERAWALGMNPAQYLANNDAHRFFARLGDAVVTGPTRTNVNDFRAILIDRD